MRGSSGWLPRLGALSGGFAVGLAALLLSGFGRRDPTPDSSRGPTPSLGAAPPSAPWDPRLGSRPAFEDVAERAGVTFQHENGMAGSFHYLEIMGAGVGLLDYNADGLLDIYLVDGNFLDRKPSPDLKNRLWRNNGDWTFTDVTDAAGVGDTGFGQGCCVGDYDNDGDPDLYVSNFGPNVLYRNEGNGTFTEVGKAAGVADPAWGQSSSFLDFDGDGWLDLYVQNYLTFSMDRPVEAWIQLGSRRLRDYPAPSNFPGSADRLYRNDGDGTFTDVTEKAGMLRPEGKGMGAACADLDDDGDTDIYVANDGMENYLFRNRGDGTFEEVGLAAGVAFDGNGVPEGSMGVDVGDYDRDGRLDMINPCLRKQSFTLYRSEGRWFEDASVGSGLTEGTSSVTGFNANFLDFDNDADLDLFFTTGGVRSNELVSPDASYVERYGVPDLLLANDGAGRFADVSAHAGAHFQRRWIGRGSATGDLDNDGRLDLVISNLRGKAVVLRNRTEGGHWIQLTLVPSKGNRDALGSSVWVEAGGVRQRGAVHGGVTYLSQSDRRLHFGLGAATKVDRLTIQWPDRRRQELVDVPADQHVTVRQEP